MVVVEFVFICYKTAPLYQHKRRIMRQQYDNLCNDDRKCVQESMESLLDKRGILIVCGRNIRSYILKHMLELMKICLVGLLLDWSVNI